MAYKNVSFDDNQDVIMSELTAEQAESLAGLRNEILSLSDKVDRFEAYEVAYNAIAFSMHLGNRYQLISPPALHNSFVNWGLRDRGLCYHWSEDLLHYLRAGNYTTLEFHSVASNKGTYSEHNSTVVSAKDKTWSQGILLDPWRNSGLLFWSRINADPKYVWALDE